MYIALTFASQQLLNSPVFGAEGAVHYTTTTTSGAYHAHKVTTIVAASGLVGIINWLDKTFTINGLQCQWDHLKCPVGGVFSSAREWKWDHKIYTLKYHDSHRELLATPNSGFGGTVRFTPPHLHVLHENEPAVIYFPFELQDEIMRMFLLMAVLQMETRRKDDDDGFVVLPPVIVN
ncbi:hypothetical protein B0H10DRAFT_2428892 [Mycena sp. CBHHK59/15]|nr:hypothetical protein B0H10DRAFT_2428892 [Mycena sp. CBHHK59/15]